MAIREPDQASGSLEQVAELLCALQTIAHGSSRLSSLNPPKLAVQTYMRIWRHIIGLIKAAKLYSMALKGVPNGSRL